MVVWSDPGFATIAGIVRESAGLVFSASRRASVEETIHRVMARTGVRDLPGFVGLMQSERVLREELIAELTVGETYFFRESEQIEFIRREVIPELRRGAGRPIRVWSAGCATGEEAYTLAILFERAGLAARTRIIGTDISPQRLETARRGRYGRWSFRGVPPTLIDTYFERHNNHFELMPRLRAAVDFRLLNLAAATYPSPAAGIQGLDLILCRNVLIYFDPETVAAVARRLLASLGESGWLFLGASDPPLAELVPCTVISTGSGLAYRRPGKGGAAGITFGAPVRPSHPAWSTTGVGSGLGTEPGDTEVAAAGDVVSSTIPGAATTPGRADTPAEVAGAERIAAVHNAVPADDVVLPAPYPVEGPPLWSGTEAELWQAYEEREYQRAIELAAGAIERGDDAATVWIVLVRALANQGRLAEAGVACASGLDRHRLSAELTYLHSVLLLHAGRPGAAAAAARRALYLDRGLVMAHLALARALALPGDLAGARRALGNSSRLLAALPADAVVTASDGARAGHLLGLARTQLRLLGEMN